MRRQCHHVGLLKPVDHGLQRQFVEFEIALYIALGDDCDIAQGVAGMVQRILAALVQDQRRINRS